MTITHTLNLYLIYYYAKKKRLTIPAGPNIQFSNCLISSMLFQWSSKLKTGQNILARQRMLKTYIYRDKNKKREIPNQTVRGVRI